MFNEILKDCESLLSVTESPKCKRKTSIFNNYILDESSSSCYLHMIKIVRAFHYYVHFMKYLVDIIKSEMETRFERKNDKLINIFIVYNKL